MVSINYSAREVSCKIVYYGPGLSGKTTNLQYVHAKVPQNTRGKLISLATEADRTLYFDFLPINIGNINGFTAKFQLYTVPGQVYYNATRKLVLRGVDGVVFVADSQPDKMDENLESLLNLEENLAEYGYSVEDLPIVIQYNKRDLPNVLSVDQLNAQLNKRGWPYYEASATIGNGIFDTLKLVIKLVLDKAKNIGAARMRPSASLVPPTEIPTPQFERVEVPPAMASERITPADSGRVSIPEPVAVATPVQTSPSEPAAFRPYPGSGRRPSPEPHPYPLETESTNPPAPRHTSMVTEMDAVSHEVEEIGEHRSSTEPTQPHMAPFLKRRHEKVIRKRGFFARLFGLK